MGSDSNYSTVGRLFGLKSSILIVSLISYELSLSHFLKYSLTGFLRAFKLLRMLSAHSLLSESTFSFEGIPVNYIIFYNWLRVEFPGKIGSPISNSATIQPTLHTSVGFPYSRPPNNIYGDRYHLVATYSDKIFETCSSWARLLASPKSQIFTNLIQKVLSHSLLINTFDGLRSRWINWAECMYLRALRIWKSMKVKWLSLKMDSLRFLN